MSERTDDIAAVLDEAADARAAAESERDQIKAALADREREVAIAVAEGLTNAEIAAALYLGLPTVKTHLGRVFAKLGVSSRLQVGLAVRAEIPDGAGHH